LEALEVLEVGLSEEESVGVVVVGWIGVVD